MHATWPLMKKTDFPPLRRSRLETLQVNLGYLCNQSCLHCHVNAGPNRKEQMTREVIDDVIAVLKKGSVKALDLTGGAPEMNPDFSYLVKAARELDVHVIDRCNLTILNEPGFEDLPAFLADQQVEVVASLPCYLEENVESQRGKGVYESSIEALVKLNTLGYGKTDSGLLLNLMYNPIGPVLPPAQQVLEADYKRELAKAAGIVFNRLFTLANMPIERFGSTLISRGQFGDYMQLLKTSYQHQNLQTVMCRSLVSVDWRGYLYDCDFNQMLGLPMATQTSQRQYIGDLDVNRLDSSAIVVGDHCYGCTAGQGSSCGGALD